MLLSIFTQFCLLLPSGLTPRYLARKGKMATTPWTTYQRRRGLPFVINTDNLGDAPRAGTPGF